MTIVRIDKQDGRERPSDMDEVGRIVWLNYQYPELVMKSFDQGQRIESPLAFYELRREETAAKEAA